MTAKEFVKHKYPDVYLHKDGPRRKQTCEVSSISHGMIAKAKTADKAWSLAKKLIEENEKMKKHENIAPDIKKEVV